MAAILTLLPLSHPKPSQDALFGHFGIYPLLVTLDNSWNMGVETRHSVILAKI